MKKKLFTADSYKHDPFELFESVSTIDSLAQLRRDDSVVIFWGGQDIPPSLYGEVPNRHVFTTILSARDLRELTIMRYCLKHDIPMIGICRGAQLLCAVTGGKLAQHIDGHGTTHKVTLHDEGNAVISCNSSHHQMMLPSSDARVLASAEGTTGMNQFNHVVKHDRVNEVVVWPHYRSIGIQPHPEWNNCPKQFVDYCKRKIQEYII